MIVDDWISNKIGLTPGETLSRDSLEKWQLLKLKETLGLVAKHSSFYQKKLAVCGFAAIRPETQSGNMVAKTAKEMADRIGEKMSINSLDDIKKLPFTTQEELRKHGSRMICVPASSVSRIVTMQETAGTTGIPKRVWFTESDQELMFDYIEHGLSVMTGSGDVFLILMPLERPGSVGDLVAKGIERIGSRAVLAGPIPTDGSRDEEVLEIMRTEGVTTGLSTSPTAARLALKSLGDETIKNRMRTFLLTAQYISEEEKNTVESIWECEVFEHYGMTEMGLGGAMACEAREGYHPREADLLFEIVAPDTGEVLPEGEQGEIVFTTLTRQAMPLIRYRTGDYSRWLPGECSCGSILKRLDRVGDRGERKAY